LIILILLNAIKCIEHKDIVTSHKSINYWYV